GHPLWDWGIYPESDEQMRDHSIAEWTVEQLKLQQEKPLFLASGFFRPHVPQFAPRKWFDLHPLETLELPQVHPDDLNDVSPYAIDLTRLKHVAPTHDWVLANDQWIY